MNTVNNDNTAASILSHLAIDKKQPEKKSNELGQSAFLELMITQLNNQDPLSPMENSAFVAQLAQFSSVEGLERLNKSFEGFSSSFMSNQALQASSLVGRSVSVTAKSTELMPGKIIAGTATLPSATSDLRINVYSASGALVDQVSLGTHPAGDVVFRWDGYLMEVDGKMLEGTAGEEPLPPGEYRFEVLASIDGETEALETALSANVNSVTLGADGRLILNLAGIGAVDISDIKQFN